MKRIKVSENQLSLFDKPASSSVPLFPAKISHCENPRLEKPNFQKSTSPVGADRSKVWARCEDGWIRLIDRPEGAYSRFRGCNYHDPIEAHRVMSGKSIELAAIKINDDIWCSKCFKYICISLRVIPIYEGSREKYTCYKCKNEFVGEMYE